MIITRTPFRMSFAGGGTDLEDFYRHEEGRVLSASINKYMYLVAHPFAHKDKIQLKYSKTECVEEVSQIEHPILREALQGFEIEKGIEVASFADVPSGTGLGSSSSFTVGLLHCLATYKNRFISKDELARLACQIEIEKLGEPIGKQDQYAAAFGGINTIRFFGDGSVSVEPVAVEKQKRELLQSRLLMFSTGKSRSTKEVLGEQKKNMNSSSEKMAALKEMTALARELETVLYQGDIDDFGRILGEGWRLKQSLASAISDSSMSEIYERATQKGGALGGKLLGAGGGGYFLFYCLEENQAKLREELLFLEELRFEFESGGSAVIHYSNADRI